MNKIIILSFVLLSINMPSYGQTIEKISGSVIDENNKLQIGNVLLLSMQDSSLITGVSFIEEPFEMDISEYNLDELLIKFASLQYSDTIVYLKYEGNPNIDLGKVVVNSGSVQLDEVTVKGDVPLFVNRPDGITEINVENTILSTSNSINEILTRSPNLIVDGNNISVFGKGEAIIYLNGQRITSERLSSISPFQIKKVEIITNPSAKYDAQGMAVINIITKDNADEGYNASASQFVTTSELAGTYTNTNLNASYRDGRVSIIGNYDLMLGNDRDLFNTVRFRPDTSDYLRSELYADGRTDYNNASNYNAGISYDLNDNSYISAEYSGFYENISRRTENTNELTSLTENSLYETEVDRDDHDVNHSVTLNYGNTLDTLGSSLFIGAQYSFFDSKTDDDIVENNTVNGDFSRRNLLSDLNSKIEIYSQQLDYTKAFSSTNSLDIGFRVAYVNNLADLNFFEETENGSLVKDDIRSSNVSYKELVPAAYINYNGAFSEKTTYRLGVRGELTNYNLESQQANREILEDTYFNLFPNFSVNSTLNENIQLYASYSSRIRRPFYQALVPFLIYQDAFTSQEGNPNLQPEKTHSFEIGGTYKTYDLKLGYIYKIDPLESAALRGSQDNSYVLKGINLKKGHTLFGSFSKTLNLNWWTSTNTISVSYNKLIDDQYNFTPTSVKPQIYLYSDNNFDVISLFDIQVLAWYLGDKYYGLYQDYARSNVTIALEKDFLDDALTFKVVANDIFHKAKPAGEYTVDGTEILYDRLFNTNYYRFILTYRFGRLKKANYKNKSTSQSENSRVQ